jgi:hypothetical protein
LACYGLPRAINVDSTLKHAPSLFGRLLFGGLTFDRLLQPSEKTLTLDVDELSESRLGIENHLRDDFEKGRRFPEIEERE